MIDRKDVEKLANLSRMKIAEEEKDRFAKEIDSILAYAHQIQEVAGSVDSEGDSANAKNPARYPHRNALREDIDSRDLNPTPHSLLVSPLNHKMGI